MTRDQMLAAEVFAYSFDNYADHLEIGNPRFEKYMPEDVRNIARANAEGWSAARLAKVLKIKEEDVEDWKRRYSDAIEIVDAATPAKAFRNAIRQTLARELEGHNLSHAELESLVTQVCYRTADLSYLLARRDEPLSKYSKALRWEGEGD
jgi:hypothetical protein